MAVAPNQLGQFSLSVDHVDAWVFGFFWRMRGRS